MLHSQWALTYSALLGKGLRAPMVIDVCKETKTIMGVTVLNNKATANERDPHPMDSLFDKD